jgi:hypothetical protein
MKQHPSRWAPALAAVLILSACGGADDGDSSPVDAPTESTDATASPDGDDLRTPTPIEVVSGGGGGGGGGAAAVDASVASDVPESEMRMAQWIAEYVIGEGMPTLPTNDVGYVFDTSTPVTAEQVAAIATALGVAGDPVQIDEGYGVNWRVGPDDGSAPSVWVSDDAQQNWNYNAAWDDGVMDEPCAVAIDSEGNETSDCPAPTPPTGVPTAEEADQRVSELLTALGVDPANLNLETYADEWFASVDVSDRTDDRAATRSWYFGFGAEGVMQYASGTLAPTQPVGPYPLVDIDTAVARLTDGFYGGFGGGMGIADSARAVIEPALEPAVVEPADDPVSDEPVLIDPMPVDPALPVESVVVTLVDVQPDLWWAWDADGTVWLLPAYRFIDSDGGWHVAPAVSDEFLIQADPTELVDPIPVEGDGGIGDGAEPVAPPESLPPVDAEDSAGEPDAVDIEPGTDPEVAIQLLEEFVGLSIEEFTAEAKASGFETRVVMQDGEPLAVTMDFRTDRVNVAVEGPRVVAIESIG